MRSIGARGPEIRFTDLPDGNGQRILTSSVAPTLNGAAHGAASHGMPDRFQSIPRRCLDDRMISILETSAEIELPPPFTLEIKR